MDATWELSRGGEDCLENPVQGDSFFKVVQKLKFVASLKKWQPYLVLNEDKKTNLVREIDIDEIKNVIWGSKEGTTPGPDGFTLSFFKTAWEVVGNDVIEAIKHFFKSGRLLRETNATFISLFSKVLEADSFKDYRPISLCNLLYKFVTKIMANRLKHVIRSVVRLNQTAFSEGRKKYC